MGSSYMSLSRKRVTLPAPLISLPAPTTNRYDTRNFLKRYRFHQNDDISFYLVRYDAPSHYICIKSRNYRWVEFHEVELEHIFWRWDVSAMVFWKGNIREYRGQEYLRVILVDEQVLQSSAYFFFLYACVIRRMHCGFTANY